jgi:A/G-specific adenine glycosylase
MSQPATFSSRLLDWFDQHGRRGLPWQSPRTPYRVWLSEIMLQQTQVTAVIPYFERFVERFPDVQTLAAAEPDEVMRFWAGLGYYARARNLQAAARQVMVEHGGQFPSTLEALESLKGVGRSTAGAILAQAHGKPAAILDGNVRRVLCRWAGIEGHHAEAAVNARLWALAESLLPSTRAADYVQAQMDLGATCCTARRPRCEHCPLVADCVAFASDRTAVLPTRKARAERPHREAWLILAEDAQGRVLLEQRPDAGIWGGLWCPPVIPLGEDRTAWLRSRHALALADEESGESIEHAFTHYDLTLHPLKGRALPVQAGLAEAAPARWHFAAALRAGELALPTPVARYFATAGLPAAEGVVSVRARTRRARLP